MWKLVVTSTLLLSSVLRTQAAQQAVTSSQLVPAHAPGLPLDVLIVSLLDGHVVALDQVTGRILWSFDSGAPLVSAKQSFASSQGLNVFPGTDGGLYAYHGITHVTPGVERLPITLPELVESAPSLTTDGSLILGRRDSKVFLLDRRTGRSVHTLSNAADALEDHSSSLGLTLGVPSDQLLYLGRQDYVVRSVRMDTKAETWNATFSKLYMIPAGVSGSVKDFLQEGHTAASAAAAAGLPHLVVGADNTLQAYDPLTKLRKWYVQFDTPPVAVYTPDGDGSNALDPDQAGRASLGGGGSSSSSGGGGGSLVPSAAARLPVPAERGVGLLHRKVKGRLPGGTSVLVGALHGSLYALPADHLMMAAAPAAEEGGSSGPAGTAAVVWPKRTGRMPLDITPAVVDMCAAGPAAKQQLPSGSSSAAAAAAAAGEAGNVGSVGSPNGSNEGGSTHTALVLLDESEPGGGVVALDPVDNGAVLEELNTLTCPQPPLGIHAITEQRGHTVGWLPLAGLVQDTVIAEEPPKPWLAGFGRRLLFTLLAAVLLLPALLYGAARGTGATHHKALAVPELRPGPLPLALPAPGSAAGPASPAVPSPSPSGKKKNKNKKNKQQQQQQQQQQDVAANRDIASNGAMHSTAVSGDTVQESSSGSSSNTQQQDCAVSSNGMPESQKQTMAAGTAGVGDDAADGVGSSEEVAAEQQGAPAADSPLGSRSSSKDAQHGTSAAAQQAGRDAASDQPQQQQQQQQQQLLLQAANLARTAVQPGASSSASKSTLPSPVAPLSTHSVASGSSAPASPVPLLPSPTPEGAAAAATAMSPTGGSGAAGADAAAAAGHGAAMMQHHRSYVDADGAVVIGRLRVGPKELGFGSAGTIVYEGVLDSRPVAVKRLLRQFYNLARKEINVLVVSDEHPNVVRCFAMEEDREFVYLALERCKTSLAQFINDQGGAALLTDAVTGAPTSWCMAVLSDTAEGLAALHTRQIVHRDLKPHNVLLTESGRAKLSDMGLSKQLVSEQSSFESHGSGGSSGWQAPEQLIAKDGGSVRQSRAVDVFSLGCIMFYCLSGGKHPFGEHYERDTNIIRGLCNLTALQKWPEAVNLLSAMLSKKAQQRPSMAGVLRHPFWWTDEQRLQFLVDVSDRVENEDREPDPTLLNALESFAPGAVGSNWGAALDVELIANLGRYRRYDYTCLRDLLRVVRNKRNHFREMPESLQQLMGPLPTGYYRYFSSRFPMLLLAVFFFALQNLSDDPNLAKYFSAGGLDAGSEPGSIFAPFNRPWDSMAAKAARASKLALSAGAAAADAGLAAAAAAAGASAGKGNSRRNSGTGLTGPSPSKLAAAAQQVPPPPGLAVGKAGAGAAAAVPSSPPTQTPMWPPGLPRPAQYTSGTPPPPPPRVASSGGHVAAGDAGSSSGAQHAPDSGTSNSNGDAGSSMEVVVGYQIAEGQEVLRTVSFPSRPGKQLCEFFVKTGHCKFGEECVFDHPAEYGVPLTEDDLPFRPGQPVCTFYYKTRQCKFGASCKFHHPKLLPILAGSAVLQP